LSFAIAVILNAIANAQRYNHALTLLHWDEGHRSMSSGDQRETR